MIGKIIVFLVWTVGMCVLLSLVVSIPTWWLWNWLVPDIFSLREITLVEAFGLILLVSCLCGARVNVETDRSA